MVENNEKRALKMLIEVKVEEVGFGLLPDEIINAWEERKKFGSSL